MLSFVHISDTHIHFDPTYPAETWPNAPSTLDGAKALVKAINNLPFRLDFVLHTGDVAYDPDPDIYDLCHEILSEIKYPTYYIAGNHDDSGALHEYLMPDVTVQSTQQGHLYYTFEHAGIQFICADSNGPVTPPMGYVGEDQLEWLNHLCSADDPRPLVIAVHHNPLPADIPWLDDYMGIQNGLAFHEAIRPARDRLRGVFFGHVHQRISMLRDGILYSSVPSTWVQFQSFPGMDETHQDVGASPGFAVVTITEDQTFVRQWEL